MRPGVSVSSFRISRFVYRADVVQIMKDRLEGYRGDYYFFQVDNDTYLLLTDFEDLVISGDTVTASSCNVFQVDVTIGNSYSVSQFSGSLSSTDYLFGFEYSWFGVSVQNDLDVLCYSSFGSNPRLRSGGDQYAFSQIFLLVVICVYVLVDSVFRRVSR